MARRTLKQWTQDFLGITELIKQSKILQRDVDGMETSFDAVERKIAPLLSGIGRIIAKHDALYAQSEDPLDNPERKAASDALGEAVIKRLRDEDNARRHTLGEL